MTRKKAMNTIKELTSKSDIVFVSGIDIYGELTNKENTMYVDPMIDVISLSLGVSVTTNRKVILIIDDNNLLKFMGSLVQAVASRQKNIFIIVISADYYISNINQNNLFNSIRAFKGLVFNMGFLVQDYTSYFSNKDSVNKLVKMFKNTIGPLIGVVRVDNNRIYNKDGAGNFSVSDFNNFVGFIRDTKYEDTTEETEAASIIKLNREGI